MPSKKPPRPTPHRTLDRLVSRLGACSRKVARTWIEAGRLKVNGTVVCSPDRWVDPESSQLLLDDRPLRPSEKVYLAMHKPRGVLTSHGDPRGRPTVYDLLQDFSSWVAPVGRLDLLTSGLLLLTNDTSFAEWITRPESSIPKTYRVRARPSLSDAHLEQLRAGLDLEDGPTRPAEVQLRHRYKSYCVFELTIREGRNRQVRRMVRAVGGKVDKLHRLRIGTLCLADLARGAFRHLSAAEIEQLRALPPAAPGTPHTTSGTSPRQR